MNKQLSAGLNNLPNYKGVMICSRPEDNPTIDKERPFVSRVKEKEKIGITPIKKPVLYTFGKTKAAKTVIRDHKNWLKGFEEEMRERADEAVIGDVNSYQFFREKEALSRKKLREEVLSMKRGESGNAGEKGGTAKCQQIDYNRLIKEVMEHSNALEKNRPTKGPLVKGRSSATLQPAWTKTQQQVDREEEREADELIEFMQGFDYKEFEEDIEVKMILHDIKSRIEGLGEQALDERFPEQSDLLKSQEQVSSQVKDRNKDLNLRRAISAHQMDQAQFLRPQTQATKKIGPSSKVNKHKAPFKAVVKPTEINPEELKKQIVRRLASSVLKANEVTKAVRKGFARIHSKSSVVRLVEGLIGNFLESNKHVLANYLGKFGEAQSQHNPRLVQHPRDRITPKCTSQNLPYLYPSPLI